MISQFYFSDCPYGGEEFSQPVHQVLGPLPRLDRDQSGVHLHDNVHLETDNGLSANMPIQLAVPWGQGSTKGRCSLSHGGKIRRRADTASATMAARFNEGLTQPQPALGRKGPTSLGQNPSSIQWRPCQDRPTLQTRSGGLHPATQTSGPRSTTPLPTSRSTTTSPLHPCPWPASRPTESLWGFRRPRGAASVPSAGADGGRRRCALPEGSTLQRNRARGRMETPQKEI